MKTHKYVFYFSLILFSLTVLLLIANEGFFLDEKTITVENAPRITLWRDQCTGNCIMPERLSPTVMAIARVTKLDYFSSTIPATIRIASPEFFACCGQIALDLSQIKTNRVPNVIAHVYDHNMTTDQGARVIANAHIELTFTRTDNIISIQLPANEDVDSIDITLDSALSRVGMSEFGFLCVLHFFSGKPASTITTESPLTTNQFIGGGISTLIATGLSQHTTVPNLGRKGAPELVAQIVFDDLDTMNRLISLLLSTFLGLWIGVVLESFLAFTLFRTVKAEMESGSAGRNTCLAEPRHGLSESLTAETSRPSPPSPPLSLKMRITVLQRMRWKHWRRQPKIRPGAHLARAKRP